MAVKTVGVNADSTADIMAKTVVEEGEWRWKHEGDTLLSCSAPQTPTGKPSAGQIEEWCGYVRDRVKSMSEVDPSAKLERKKREQNGSEHTDVRSVPDATDNRGTGLGSVQPDVQPPQVREGTDASFVKDPEQFAVQQWEFYSKRAAKLESDLKETNKLARQWEAIAAAAQQAEEEE